MSREERPQDQVFDPVTDGREELRVEVERDVDAELRFHLDRVTDELVRHGLAPAEAREAALRRFGDLARHRREIARIALSRRSRERRVVLMETLIASLRRALREARRAPAFALGVIVTLGLGIGVNALTFGLVDRLLLAGPLGVREPERMRRVFIERAAGDRRITTQTFTYPDYRDLRAAQQIDGIAAETRTGLILGRGEAAVSARSALVTSGYFDLLGVSPHLGRFFSQEEAEEERAQLAVLSHAFWLRHFDGDADVLGRRLELGDGSYTVIGVTPPKFTGSAVTRVDVFLPLEAAAEEMVSGNWESSRNVYWLQAVLRLSSGTAEASAESEATALHRAARADSTHYDPEARVLLPKLVQANGPGVGEEIPVALALSAVALLVLLIAIANVANLFQARALRRATEIGIHFALGARRSRLLAEQMVEGILLSLLGGLAAVWLASVGGRTIGEIFLPEIEWLEHGYRTPFLLALFGLALLTGGIASLVPAWIAAGSNPWRQGVAGSRHSTRRTRTQTVLLLTQAAFSVMLLVGAGLFVRSLDEARAIDIGLDTDGLFVANLDLGADPPPGRGLELTHLALERVGQLHGVESAGLSAASVPFHSNWAVGLKVPGLEERPRVDSGGPYIYLVTTGFFETVGLSILQGRGFTDADREGALPVVVVNQTMARMFWPPQKAVGNCLEIGPGDPPCSEVVGVVEDAHLWGLQEGDNLLYYTPLAQGAIPRESLTPTLFARAAASDDLSVTELQGAIRRELYALDPSLRSASARPFAEILAPELRSWRLGASLFSAFGLLALAVAGVGLYSVLSFEVAGRRREIGVRAALGATRDRILRLILLDSFKVLLLAILLGATVASALTPVLQSMLYGVRPWDAASLSGAAALLLAVGLLASWLPARRAAAVDPAKTLREE